MNKLITLVASFTMGLTINSQAVTVVLDFNDPDQAATERTTKFGDTVDTFNIVQYGFSNTTENRLTITNSILSAVKADYQFDLGSATGNAALNGKRLDIDFVIGDAGMAPSNGDSDYYVIQIGFGDGALGVASFSSIRQADGSAGIHSESVLGAGGVRYNAGDTMAIGSIVGSVYTSNIAGILSSSDSGRLDRTTHAIAGTLSHEIGHALSLLHLDYGEDWTTANNRTPLMASGSTGLPNFERKFDRQFSLTGTDSEGNSINHVQQLQTALGVVDIAQVPEPSSSLLILSGLGFLAFSRRRSQIC